MLDDYNQHQHARAESGIPAKPLTAQQTDALIQRLINDAPVHHPELIHLLTHSVPPGTAGRAAAFFYDPDLRKIQPG